MCNVFRRGHSPKVHNKDAVSKQCFHLEKESN